MARRSILAFVVVVSIVVGNLFGPTAVYAQSVSRLPVVLLVKQSFYATSSGGCNVDSPNASRALIKVNDPDGKRRGGAWFTKGEVINSEGPSGEVQDYCAFVRRLEIKTDEEVDLLLNDVYLTTIDLEGYEKNDHLILEVDHRGLVAEEWVDSEAVQAMGLTPEQAVVTGTAGTNSGTVRTKRSESSTRSQRSNRTSNSSETQAQPTATSNRSQSRSGSTTQSQSGIVTGEWDLEGDSSFDLFFVEIAEDTGGYGQNNLLELDPIEIAVEIGFSYIGEGAAPEGCRIFAYSGPMGIPAFIAFCADGEFIFYAVSTDKDILDDAVNGFINGRPFSIPWGYSRSY